MPTEQGVVVRTEDGRAWVKTRKSSACEGCRSKDSCSSPGGGKDMMVEAVNSAGAVPGDLVVISFDAAPLVRVFSLVYIFPVMALMVGAVIGQRLSGLWGTDESLTSLISGGLFFAGAFFIVKFCSNRMAEKGSYQPKVLRVLSAAS